MIPNREQLFAELNKMSAVGIEAGLEAGVWGEPSRQLVEHYLDQMQVTTLQLEATETAKAAAQVAEGQSRKAISLAIAALIIAGGAMVAAIASAFVAVLALRLWTL
jgi:hypothetical protein